MHDLWIVAFLCASTNEATYHNVFLITIGNVESNIFIWNKIYYPYFSQLRSHPTISWSSNKSLIFVFIKVLCRFLIPGKMIIGFTTSSMAENQTITIIWHKHNFNFRIFFFKKETWWNLIVTLPVNFSFIKVPAFEEM